MADVLVTCVTTNEDGDITHLGGAKWRWTSGQVIESVENQTNTFHTLVGGKRAEVGVATASNGRKYLRTHADGYWNNNLEALPQCG